ncbi:MAG: ribosome maturation factor RimP [Gemmatimonadetes bacterium]|nr:ribosome maturation factor RimP [Gemmatimonadota bacterium]
MNEELAALGMELVELRFGGSKGRPVLDVRVDRLDREKVKVGDCQQASRAIEARLDADPSLIPSRYVLEVSSPGMERPLRKAAEWERFVGRLASVNAPVLGGRQELEIVAVEGEAGQERLRLRDAKGIEQSIALADVKDARLAFHWKP